MTIMSLELASFKMTITHWSWGTIPELSDAGVAGVMGVMGVRGL